MTIDIDSDVVIVGASHAATQLAHGLRRFGWEGGITIVGEEPVLPYHRPPLSKDFLKGNKTFEQILLRQQSMYTKSNVELMLGRRVVSVDRQRKKVVLENGDSLGYEKLALTTGARPRRLSVPGEKLRGVCYVRTVADIHSMLRDVKPGGHAVIVGGGYIGLEAAASLRALDMNVTVLEAEERILQRVTCPLMSAFFTRVHREEGVNIRTGCRILSIEGDQRVSGVRLHDGEVEPADLVVVGIGIEPNVSLAEKAGLEVRNGIVVNDYGQTADPDVFSAGDCASFVHPRYGRFMRLESVQHANDQAMTVARFICDETEQYRALPWFWSDQFDIKLQIAGLSEGCDQIIERGDSSVGRSFSLCYLREGRLLAVDAVNRPKDFVFGKKLIDEGKPVSATALADADMEINAAVEGT